MSTPQRTSRVGTRREFLASSGLLAGAAVAGTLEISRSAHAAGSDIIQLALIGCGGRGSGAVVDAMASPQGPVKLVAMADLFEPRLLASLRSLSEKHSDKVEVPAERRFLGFKAYRAAIDCLRPGDVAMLAGYAGFRPAQLEYAVAKGVNVFMEKSFACDPPGLRRVLAAGEAAGKKNLKIAAGLMCRHSKNRQQLIARIRDGQLGPIQLIRAYRMEAAGSLGPRPSQEKELDWQIRNFTSFLWVSGGLFAEMDIHQIDEICWIKDAWPVSAHGIGGRAVSSTDCSQNLDSFSIEWTFADGTKAYDVVRYLPQCHTEFATYLHGTRCAAQFSGNIHAGTVQTYKDQRIAASNIDWKAAPEQSTPWQAEWDALLEAIRQDRPHNEAQRAAMSNLADVMGRAAVHSGKVVTWDEAMASHFQFCPNLDDLTPDSLPPVQADAQGRYPVPVPGKWTEL